MPRLLSTLILLGLLLPGSSTPTPRTPPSSKPISFSLDGVTLEICATALTGATFITPAPSNHIQIATAYQLPDNIIEFTVSAIPVGVTSGAESLPAVTTASNENTLRTDLAQMRRNAGGIPQDGPSGILFGRTVTSKVSIVSLPGATGDQKARLTEWVIVAGNRTWLVRAAEKMPDTAAAIPKSTLFSDLTLTSNNLSKSSSSLTAFETGTDLGTNHSGQNQSLNTATNLPTPAWWNGVCDMFYYYQKTGNKYYAYPLGASYRNVLACGPRPAFKEGPDVVVRFFAGAWGEYEWECVELSMRFMYLAYGVKPYPGNGNQVVKNYSGSALAKITNGTSGKYPVGGDILSYCSTCTYGHTAVVMSSTIDSNGNGTITVLEQNNSKTGQSTLSISNWRVYGNAGSIIGWLHPTGSPTGTLDDYNLYFPFIKK